MRAGTAYLLTLGVLLAAGVATDALLTRHAEERATALVSPELDAPAAVTLSGWPVALRLAAGRVPEIRVVAAQVPAADVTLQRVDARLFDVRLRLADLDAETPPQLRGARGGTIVVEIGEEDVARLAGLPGAVRLGEGIGQVDVGGTTVDVAVSVEQGVVVLRPIGAVADDVPPVTVEVPALPGNPILEEVRITRGLLRISGRVQHLGPVELSLFSPSPRASRRYLP